MPGHVRSRGKRADGTTKWQARWRNPLDQNERREKQFRRKGAAQRWITDMDSAVYSGSYVDPRKADRPFSEVVDAWRSTWIDLEPKTKAGYESILNHHLLPAFGKRKLSAITTEKVQAYVNRLSTGGLAPSTVRSVYSVLRSALNAGVRQRMLVINPCTGVSLPRAAKEQMLFLTAQDVRTLSEAVPSHWRTLVYMAAYTGLRAGELGALRRRDIDPLRGTLHVRQALKDISTTSEHVADHEKGLVFGDTKTHAERIVSLPQFLRDFVAEHLSQPAPGGNGPDDLLFTTPTGKPIRHGLFYRRVFKPAVRDALPERLHGLRFHDLRHTCASLSIAQDAHPKLIQARLGHSSIQITLDRYGHLFPSVEAALADSLDAAFRASTNEALPRSVPAARPVREATI